MGCDIHAYIDVANTLEDGYENVSSFAKLDISRDYWLFGLLANVRVNPTDLGTKLLVEPRGLPKRLSHQVEADYLRYVLADGEAIEESGCCHKSDADRWVKSGSSEWYGEGQRRVTDPDAHSMSYLYVFELKAVQEQYSKLIDDNDVIYLRANDVIPEGYVINEHASRVMKTRAVVPEVRRRMGPHKELAAIIAAMDALNTSENQKLARFVFWFDN
jgi:hypothetical protein